MATATTVKMTHGAAGSKRVIAPPPSPSSSDSAAHPPGNMFKRKAPSQSSVDPKRAAAAAASSTAPPPNKLMRTSSAIPLSHPKKKSTASSGSSHTQKSTASSPASIAEGTAAMSKGATPAMKKGALDRQMSFITDNLYSALQSMAERLEMEDPSYIFYFYHTFLKSTLEKEIEMVKTLKTGGTNAPHLCHFTPLNKFLQISPDIAEMAHDVRSEKQLKFYKMLVFNILEATNEALREAGFKGKIYLKKNFYRNFESYWHKQVEPVLAAEKERLLQEEEEEAAVAAASAAGEELGEEEEESETSVQVEYAEEDTGYVQEDEE